MCESNAEGKTIFSSNIKYDAVDIILNEDIDIHIGFWIDLNGKLISYDYMLYRENGKCYIGDLFYSPIKIRNKIIRDKPNKKIMKVNGQAGLYRLKKCKWVKN